MNVRSVDHRMAITVCVTLAAFLEALDGTIANVALPYMQGTMSATQEQMGWVLTSYLVAAGITTPATGFLVERLGLGRLLLISVAGFTLTSMLCGVSQTLPEVVLFRLLQGVFGAPLIPLSQTVLMNIYPPEKQGSAMSVWSIVVVAGPAIGSAVGGWLTFSYSWRYVFFVNVPVGIACLTGLWLFFRSQSENTRPRLDWMGFAALSIAIGAFQLLLDRGEEKDWFGSREICIEAIIAAAAFYVFLVQTFTAKEPFFRPALLRDRNFSAGTLFVTVVGLSFFASLALQPPYLQALMGYPILTTGLVLAPQGVAMMAASVLSGRLVGKVDTRLLLAIGLGLTAWSFQLRTGWTPDIGASTIIINGSIQGVGIGLLYVPLSVASLASLSPEIMAEGASFYTVLRLLGSSVGVAVVNAMIVRNTQVNHADIGRYVTLANPGLLDPRITRFLNPFTSEGRAALDAVVTNQAQVIAYMDDYKMLTFVTLAMFPLILAFRAPDATSTSGQAMAH
ncbi:MAG TPA: DHA2 family efflux MFS transporter permease subunit [Caulobacteraceae bacterium]|jgi:DHA2 family multidrug resistance protein